MKRSSIDKKSEIYKEGTRLITVFLGIGVLFLMLVCHLTYIELWGKNKFMDNAFNQRQWKKEQNTIRGDITDCGGVVLAHSEKQSDGTQTRVYDFGSDYAHVIGYNSKVYGKSQLELTYNKELAGLTELSNLSDITAKIQGEKKGNTVKLTILNNLQQTAIKALSGRAGSVVALDPKTGEVLCMASNPSFNPSAKYLADNWTNLNSAENSPFLFRATSGQYSPGSIFKTVILSAAYENGLRDMEFDDNGEVTFGGKTFKNSGSHAYGHIDLKKAYTVSSNVAFMMLGNELGEEKVEEYIKKFKLVDKINFDIPTQNGHYKEEGSLSEDELAQLSIGQGTLLVTPLKMAMMAGTIANGGVMMKPYIVKQVKTDLGIDVMNGRQKALGRVIQPATADFVKECMESVVTSGTGTAASVYGIKVAGKTGTAENEIKGKDHAWFVGFAPADDPQIAVCVMLEYSGSSGGAAAAPVAAKVIREYLK